MCLRIHHQQFLFWLRFNVRQQPPGTIRLSTRRGCIYGPRIKLMMVRDDLHRIAGRVLQQSRLGEDINKPRNNTNKNHQAQTRQVFCGNETFQFDDHAAFVVFAPTIGWIHSRWTTRAVGAASVRRWSDDPTYKWSFVAITFTLPAINNSDKWKTYGRRNSGSKVRLLQMCLLRKDCALLILTSESRRRYRRVHYTKCSMNRSSSSLLPLLL